MWITIGFVGNAVFYSVSMGIARLQMVGIFLLAPEFTIKTHHVVLEKFCDSWVTGFVCQNDIVSP